MKRQSDVKSEQRELIIDCPFTNGDLTEHVSGATLQNDYLTYQDVSDVVRILFYQEGISNEWSAYYIVNFPYTVPFTPDFTREYDIFPVSSTYGNIYIFGHSISLEYGKSQPLSRQLNINTPSAVNYISRNNWHHIKEIFDADNGTYEFWVDGNLRESSALNPVTDERYSKNILRISCGMWNNGSSGVYFLLKNLQYYLN